MSATTPDDITGIWLGEFTYPEPGIPPVSFVATLSESDGTLTGTTSDRSEFLHDFTEEAFIRGQRVGKSVDFYKYYNGDGAYGHVVAYAGEINENGNIILGHWSIDDYSGTFSMWRERFAHNELFVDEEIREVEPTNLVG
jgi:hypothetical protein